jgi:hypothetical protein
MIFLFLLQHSLPFISNLLLLEANHFIILFSKRLLDLILAPSLSILLRFVIIRERLFIIAVRGFLIIFPHVFALFVLLILLVVVPE